MPNNHDGEEPSRSPRRTSYDCDIANYLQHLTVQASLFPAPSDFALTDVTADPEVNEYSNKQSVKANSGLDFGGLNGKGEAGSLSHTTKATSASHGPTVDVDFSQFSVPNPAPPPVPLPVEQLIHPLLHPPPPHAFVHGVLSIQWVIGALGLEQFRFRASDERWVLTPGSEVRIQGVKLGLLTVVLEWLCGDEEESSPAEQGMLLTEKFFEEMQKEAQLMRMIGR